MMYLACAVSPSTLSSLLSLSALRAPRRIYHTWNQSSQNVGSFYNHEHERISSPRRGRHDGRPGHWSRHPFRIALPTESVSSKNGEQ